MLAIMLQSQKVEYQFMVNTNIQINYELNYNRFKIDKQKTNGNTEA